MQYFPELMTYKGVSSMLSFISEIVKNTCYLFVFILDWAYSIFNF